MFIVNDIDTDAFPGAFDEKFSEDVSDEVTFDDVEFDEDIVLCVPNGIVNIGIGGLGINEEFAGVSPADVEIGQVSQHSEKTTVFSLFGFQIFFELIADVVG